MFQNKYFKICIAQTTNAEQKCKSALVRHPNHHAADWIANSTQLGATK